MFSKIKNFNFGFDFWIFESTKSKTILLFSQAIVWLFAVSREGSLFSFVWARGFDPKPLGLGSFAVYREGGLSPSRNWMLKTKSTIAEKLLNCFIFLDSKIENWIQKNFNLMSIHKKHKKQGKRRNVLCSLPGRYFSSYWINEKGLVDWWDLSGKSKVIFVFNVFQISNYFNAFC